MAKAICSRCGWVGDYQPVRGFRLAEQLCPSCDTRTMKQARWMGNGYAVLKHEFRPRGRLVHCGLCHRSRRAKGGNLRTAAVPFRCPFGSFPRRIYPAGTKYCWHHEIEPLTEEELRILNLPALPSPATEETEAGVESS